MRRQVFSELIAATSWRAMLAACAGLDASPPTGVITCTQPSKQQLLQLQQAQQRLAEKLSKGGEETPALREGVLAGNADAPVVYNDFNPLMLHQVRLPSPAHLEVTTLDEQILHQAMVSAA